MTLVWLSSGLPADRSELAAALPPGFSLVPSRPSADPNAAADVGVLPVGSLCVATVFETELLAQLAGRPTGVGLLVIGPTAADGVTAASSVPELAAAIQQTVNSPVTAPVFPLPPEPTDPAIAAPVDAAPGSTETAVPPDGMVRTPLRTRLIAAGAVALGLAIGGIVIGTTEGTSSATSAPGGGFGNFGNPGANAGPNAGARGGGTSGGFGGGQLPAGVGNGAAAQDIVACLRKQGITIPTNQLLQNSGDPKLRQAFLTCVQQLRGGASSRITGGP